jgi:arylsulfatase A-like enzyme/tetratricopeptide (TPR) repeat protein
MTMRIPTTRRSRLALTAIAAGLIAAGGYGWVVYRGDRHVGAVRNVLLISIDTCRADHLGCYGYKRPTTPHIDALARAGVLFEQVLTPVPLTTPAHSSLLTGTYPPTHGVRLNNGQGLPESSVTLAEILRDAGYRTAAFVGGFPLDAGFGLNQGFETYDDRFTKKSETSASLAERTAEEVGTPAMAWLQANAHEPFFLFLHFYDAHLPYDPPEPFASSFGDDPYSGELAYVDEWIGRILERLRSLSVDGNTLVVLTADHGESLDEHGEKSHGYFIYQSTQRVPLVIRAPGGPKGKRVAGRVSLIDLMPTVLDLTGVKPPPRLQGASLRPALEGKGSDASRPLYCESLVAGQFQCASLHGIVEGGWKYIRAPRPELYDLTKDPGEKNNVIAADPRVAQRLSDRLDVLVQQMEAPTSEHDAASDPEAVRRLQSLGYVGGGVTPAASDREQGLEDPKDFVATYERLEKANALFHSHRSDEARKELGEIVASRPRLVAAEEQLAQIARHDHRTAEAVEHYARIVAILEDANARGDLAAAHFNLAFALRELGKDDEAVAQYEKAISIKPDYVEAHNSLGLALVRSGRIDEGIAHYETALKLRPDHAQAHNNLGAALEQKGRLAEAIAHFARAVALKPDYAGALGHLAWIRATSVEPQQRNGAEAVQLAERACAITGRSVAGHLDALAAAYAESQRFDEAVAAAQEAVAVARASGQADAAAQIEARAAGYRARRPYRAPSR